MFRGSLTPRQQQIFRFIQKYFHKYGYPPTYEEIGKAVGLSSTATIFTHISALEKRGYIKRQKGVSRGIEIIAKQQAEESIEVTIPILGFISGIKPLEENKNEAAQFTIRRKELKGANPNNCFVLQVKGNNLFSEGILAGDLLVIEYRTEVENGAQALVILDENIATIRRIIYTENLIRLESTTDPLRLITTTNPKIKGRLLSLYRFYI